jgi:hypothetical protein
MTLASESASMIRPVMVVFPEPVPPQIPMMSGRESSGRMAGAPIFAA